MRLCHLWQKVTLVLLLAGHVLAVTGSFWRACRDESTNDRLSSTDKLESKIVGGAPAKQSQFPYQVSIRTSGWNSRHFCGGAILDEKHVITAAHCVTELRPKDVNVVAGDVNLDRSACTSVRRSVKDIFIHENFTSVNFHNDIAVLRVTKQFPADKLTLQKIEIATNTSEFANNECQISGWGSMKYEDPHLPNKLHYANVSLYPEKYCSEVYSGGYYHGMLCASGEGTDSCQGDSGGPLQCDSVLVGIVSWGYKCAQPGYPGVYTEVAHYEDWIRAQLVRPSRAATGSRPLLAVVVVLFLVLFRLALW